jgi:N-acyl-D-aspartate/D-glutamate deacylase
MATSTDAGIALPEDGPVHARFYGSYPRKLRRYALDDNVIRLEDAIRSSTSLPAQILGLRGRGLLRAGFWADLVVIDLAKVEDKATFTDPHQYSEGIELVLVNGQPVVEGGRPAGALAGKVLQLTPPAARSARR